MRSLSLIAFCHLVGAAVYERLADVPSSDFDFIIVGGGTAGNVLANRLTEDPRTSVLVLEAGGSNQNMQMLEIPFDWFQLPGTAADWNFTTTPQSGLNGRSLPYPRGYVLGGSSSINGMLYTRGSSDDFDSYAAITGDSGWSWDNLQPYIRKNERFTAPSDHHNTSGEFDPSVHGFYGINSVTLQGFSYEIDKNVLQAVQESPEAFHFNLDMNSGNQLGIGFVQVTIFNGSRSSSATSYLAPRYIQRPNLHVLLHSRVTRLLSTGKAQFQTVEFTANGGDSFHHLSASKEVILSAGAIGTPTILLHSGIGKSSDLEAVGITVCHELSSVGRNLSDHPTSGLSWRVNSTDTYETIDRSSNLTAKGLQQWIDSRTGPFSAARTSKVGFFRVSDKTLASNNFSDPSAGPNTAHFEFIIYNGFAGSVPPEGNYMSIYTPVVSPASRGSLTISSSNPLDDPLIDPNFYASEIDLLIQREAIRKALEFVQVPALKDYVISPTFNFTNNSELDEYIRNTSSSTFHPVGTASMSAVNASYGVVNPDLKVKGLKGLRIVDASVLPFVPAAHTQAAVYIFAERAADLVKQDWGIL